MTVLTDPTDDPPIGPAALAALQAQVRGRVLRAGQPGWEEEVTGFNAAVTHAPAVVLAAEDAADIHAGVRYAAEARLSIGVQATGHGANTPMQGGLLLTTRRVDGVHVDPAGRTATVGAGTRWRQVIDATAPYGLAPLNGSSSGVGAVGYTLGGGIPVMGRTFGFAADHVRSLQVATPDGELRHVDAAHQPDLYWGLRGGGGTLGLVTAMTIDLVPVATIYAGGIFYPATHVATVLHAWREWCPTLPETITTSVAILRLPSLPQVPEPLRGQTVAHLRYCQVPGATSGADHLGPMRAVAPAVLDTVTDRPYATVDAVHQDPDHPVPCCQRGQSLHDVTAETVDALVAVAGPDVAVPLIVCELRQLGGALRRPPAGGNAVGGRDAAYCLCVIGVMTPETATVASAAVDAVLSATQPWATGRTLLNMHGTPGDRDDRARPWDPATYHQLRELGVRYDPHGLLCHGHAIIRAA